MSMKVALTYDFAQKSLMGESEIFDVAEGITLGDLLASVDKHIQETGASRGIETGKLRIMDGCELNACIAIVNGSPAPTSTRLSDGDRVELMYGYCGG